VLIAGRYGAIVAHCSSVSQKRTPNLRLHRRSRRWNHDLRNCINP
jgi:hypothetical protein